MGSTSVSFSVRGHAAWAPGLATPAAWQAWAAAPHAIAEGEEPKVAAMPPMLRRRAGALGRMALEVAYACLPPGASPPTVFCSRHGEVARALELLSELAAGQPLSPTLFGVSVHNANAGLFSIARHDRANHVALAAGASTVEHGVIEACGLLADGAEEVLLVVYDGRLPADLRRFEDCAEQPHAWAWRMGAPGPQAWRLTWDADDAMPAPATAPVAALPPGLLVLQYFLRDGAPLERLVDGRRWRWTRDA